MSNARARANQKLYHAKILIDAWQLALQQEHTASRALEFAFGDAICAHLSAAYGWFLLEIAQPAQLPDNLPRACRDLPPAEEGLKTAPEILEFTQLEREPWLERLVLAGDSRETTALESANSKSAVRTLNLAVVGNSFDPETAQLTHDKLLSLFDRMTDSLDEY